MNKFELDGTVVSIGETKSYGENDFQKRELVLVQKDDKYENNFVFEFVADKTKLLDNLLEGANVTVHFNIRCRKVEQPKKAPMYFTSLSGWKVDVN